MKVILLTSYHYPVASLAAQTFLKNTLLKKHGIEVVGIVATPIWQANRRGWLQMLKFIKKSGWKFAARSMGASFVQNLTTRVARYFVPNKYREIFEINELAEQHRLPYLKTHNINGPEVIEFCKKLDPDLFVSALLLQMVKRKMLDLPSMGSINFHPALVQEHRGTFASFWALFNNRRNAGATVHWMTEKFDDGPVILQRWFKIQRADSLYSLDYKNARLGGNLLAKALVKIKRQKAEPLSLSLGGLFQMPKKKHTLAFEGSGKKVVGSWREFFKL